MLELVNDGPAFDCYTGRVVTLPDGSKVCVDDTVPVKDDRDGTPILGLRAYQDYLRSLGIQPLEPSHTVTTTNSDPWFSRAENGDLVIFGHAIKPLYALGGAAAALWLFTSTDGKK